MKEAISTRRSYATTYADIVGRRTNPKFLRRQSNRPEGLLLSTEHREFAVIVAKKDVGLSLFVALDWPTLNIQQLLFFMWR